MRTTSTENEETTGCAGLLFPDIPGYGEVLAALSGVPESSSRDLSGALALDPQAALSALRYRRLVVQDGSQIRLNDSLPFMPALRACMSKAPVAPRLNSVQAESDIVRRAARLLFRKATTAHVLVGLAGTPLTGPDLRRVGEALCEEAKRLCKAGVAQRTMTHGITHYELDPQFPRALQLRELLIAMEPYVAAERIPHHEADARTNYGFRHYRARLSDGDVRQIITRKRRGESAAALAHEFGITAVYVRALCRSEYRCSAAPTPRTQ